MASVYLTSAIEIYEKELKEESVENGSELKSTIFCLCRRKIDALQRSGRFTDAARAMLQAARAAGSEEGAREMLQGAINAFQEENRPAQALQSIDAALEDAVSAKDFASFNKLTPPAFALHRRLNYGHKSDSLALTMAIIGAYIGDSVLLDQALGLFDSYSSDEFLMAEILEKALKNADAEALAEAKAHDGKISLTPGANKLLNEIEFKQ